MLVSPEELKTELYPEVIEQITRRDPNEVIKQIKAAEDYAKGYLFKYDLKALFGVEAIPATDNSPAVDAIPPTIVDENLKKVIKVIASYWLVRKSNTGGASLDLFRDDWQLLIGTKSEPGWLTDVKEGRVNPEWPYKPNNPETDLDESQIDQDVYYTSNPKRNQHF